MLERVFTRVGVLSLRNRFSTRRARTIVTATAVLAVMTTIFGAGWNNGYPADQVRLLSGAVWLPSSHVGQLTLLDGSSAEVAAQVQVAPPGHRLDVVQHETTAYVINHTEGSIRRIDGATFASTPPVTPIPAAGQGLQAYANADTLYALDSRHGILTQADPTNLTSHGGLLRLADQASRQAAILDDASRLWVLDAITGNLTWIKDGQPLTRRQAIQPGPGTLVLADNTPVLVDISRRTATTLDPKTGNTENTTRLDVYPDDTIQLGGSPHAPRLHVVTSPGALTVCDLTSTSCQNAIPLSDAGTDLGSPIETGDRVFIPDYTHGRVWIVDLKERRVVAQPTVLSPPVRFQLLTHDGIVFFNDPNSEHAGVIRHDGTVIHVPKYDPTPSAENNHESTSSAFPDRTSTGDGSPSRSTGPSATGPPIPDHNNLPSANPSSRPGPGGDSTAGGDPGPGGDPSDLELFDDFSGSTINSEKWGRGSGFDTVPPLIYAQDGLLNMQITPEHGSGENSASLQANLPRPARAISFEMIVLSSEGLNDGGGSAVISSRDSHNHKVAFGPGGDGFPGMEYFICNKESGCDDGVYEDFDHPGRSQLQLQQRYNVLIQQSDTGWSFQVDGFPEATAQLEDGPIQSFDLSLYSFGEGVFHVAVDNVRIDYAT